MTKVNVTHNPNFLFSGWWNGSEKQITKFGTLRDLTPIIPFLHLVGACLRQSLICPAHPHLPPDAQPEDPTAENHPPELIKTVRIALISLQGYTIQLSICIFYCDRRHQDY